MLIRWAINGLWLLVSLTDHYFFGKGSKQKKSTRIPQAYSFGSKCYELTIVGAKVLGTFVVFHIIYYLFASSAAEDLMLVVRRSLALVCDTDATPGPYSMK